MADPETSRSMSTCRQKKLRGQDCWIQGGPKRPVMDRLALPKTWQKLWMFLFQGSYPPPKTDSSSMKIGRAPKGNDRLPTIHFQVLLLLVSGRVTWNLKHHPGLKKGHLPKLHFIIFGLKKCDFWVQSVLYFWVLDFQAPNVRRCDWTQKTYLKLEGQDVFGRLGIG